MERLMLSTLETCRCWYNDCMAERKAVWDERKESSGCGITLDRDHNAAINILHRAGRARGSEKWSVAACVLPEAFGL